MTVWVLHTKSSNLVSKTFLTACYEKEMEPRCATWHYCEGNLKTENTFSSVLQRCNREDRKLLNVMKVFICNISQRKAQVTFLKKLFRKATWKPSGEFHLLLQARTLQTVVWVSYIFMPDITCITQQRIVI